MNLPVPPLEIAPARAVPTRSAVITPRRELASCVRAYVTRGTTGAQLQDHQRHNFYPASLSCSISWTLQGQTELVRVGNQVFNAMARSRVIFSGPHTQACETRNPGPVEFFLLMFMPDAFHALTGVDLQAYTDQHRPLDEVLGDDWQVLAADVLAAGDDAQRIKIIESFLLPQWQATRPPALPLAPHYLTDWVRSLATRCVVSSTGKSLRQIERRVKQWTGQTQRQLLRMARGEETYVHMRALRERGDLVWSDVATEKGFSDQSHFCREFRKLTGLQPETVLGNLENDERLWIYRAW